MANVVSSFPLLRLPEKALTKTLQCMTAIDRFGISWCSERTKQIIVGMKLKAFYLRVEITHCIMITCQFQDENAIEIAIWSHDIPIHFAGVLMGVRVSERNTGLVDFVEYNSRDEDEESERYAGSGFDDDEDEFDLSEDDDEVDDNDMNGSEDERENEISDSNEEEDDQDSEVSSEESDSEEEERRNNSVYWNLEEADDVNTLLYHCLEIYHKSQLSSVAILEGADRFDIDFLQDALDGYSTVDLAIYMDADEFAHQVVSFDIPSKKLNASAFIFENKEDLHKVLIQNYDFISLGDPLIRNQRLILDDLLMINSPYIEIENALISDKNLNRFIKHWIRGSNSRLKYMTLTRRDGVGFNKEIILKGIDHQELPAGVVREVNVTCFEGFRVVRVPSGFNFTRHDLTEATIRMKNKRGRAALEFIVWD